MPLVAGIDCGTGFTKAVIVSAEEPLRVLGKGRARSGIQVDLAAEAALAEALREANADRAEIGYVAATGFGRYSVSFRDIAVTEITAAARGAFFLDPRTTALLDVGSQCTRAIGVGPNGKVKTFKSNDKCAAGSGMFIARAAKYLEIPLEEVGGRSRNARHSQPISSICAVLAESEIINHVSAGVAVEDILRGIHDSLAERAGAMLKRVGMAGELTFIGGVARQEGMVEALRQRLGVTVYVPPECEFVCALGASVLGVRRARQRQEAQVTA